MEKVIGHPNKINKYYCKDQIEHKCQPECANPVDPFAKSRGSSPFKNRTGNKHRYDGPKTNDIPLPHWLTQ